ncbi:Lipase PAD [Heracleum sosnowskyi]|uniref:Lipase PAD n=1 Tax=Heracleum sosnowskyi TaxID=360622 RepID=A0AAD8H9F4_9APIA|nr:Lipase PAD [Heracleum sosnowskyi]
MEDNMIEAIGMSDDLIKRACSASMKAHKLSGKHYLRSKIRGSPFVVFAFAGSWSVKDFFKHTSFGEEDINLKMFRSMKSIGPNETAQVNAAFAERFEIIHKTFKTEVDKDRKKGKQIVFAGHSSGGPMAIFATLWFLENTNPKEGEQFPFRCLTFGSPLTGDKILGHAIKRENWSRNFTHFVMKHDIVPRIMLAPRAHIEGELQKVLNFFKNYKTAMYPNDLLQPQVLFREVMKNASSVASYAASILMGCPNTLLNTLSTYVQLSPYKPFGKYIFCTGNGKLVVVENSDAVLQMLFYSSQLDSEAQDVEIAFISLHQHMSYEKELQESLAMKNLIFLNHLQNLSLSSVGETLNVDSTDMALNDLGLSARARLCLRAAGEFEDQKKRNQSSVDKYEVTIAKALKEIEAYQTKCEGHNMNYYDAFKRQKDNKSDFEANIKRIELSGKWDEIIDLLENYELPDEFEGRQNWIKLGTEFRQLVEPLDIANYYRHFKNDDCGPYMGKGRPRRYRFTQRWSEHASKTEFRSISSSCIWAVVEELPNEKFEDIKEKLEALEKALQQWEGEGKLGKHVFSEGSTVVDCWKTFPDQYRSISGLAQYMNK